VNTERVASVEPASLRPVISVFRTPTACSGAAASYIMRRIAYRAGAYAPGIDDGLFFELHATQDGGSVDHVLRWFDRRSATLRALGYRLKCKCVAMPMSALLAWIRQGIGYRGLVLETAGHDAREHAIGVTFDRVAPRADEEVVRIDPWPGTARDRAEVSELIVPDREGDVPAVGFHWIGWA
jgi:hypothetical protein